MKYRCIGCIGKLLYRWNSIICTQHFTTNIHINTIKMLSSKEKQFVEDITVEPLSGHLIKADNFISPNGVCIMEVPLYI